MGNDTSVLDTIREMVQNTTVEKVYGSPVTKDGVTMLPVAKVTGGGGGGSGTGPGGEGQEAGGTGGGLGLTARPLGVFVLKEGKVGWRPAVDLNKVILGGQIVMVTAIIVAGILIRARKRR